MPGEKTAQRDLPPSLAAYIARSALRSSWSAVLDPAARKRDADARSYANDVPLDAERREQRPEHALRGSLGLDRRGRVLEQHRELVAAHARSEVVLAQRRAQALGDRHEQRIAGGVPERVVDALEIVEVEEHHRRRVVVACERGLDAQGEERAVGEPRQRIVARLVRQPLLERRHRGQRARRLTALERAAGMRPDRLQQPPLAQAERLAALDCEQPDDARVSSQCDDDRGGQAEARQPRPALLTGVREVDHGRGLELLEQCALGRRGLTGEGAPGALAPVDLRAQDAALGRVQDERGAGGADQRTGVLEQDACSRLGAGGGVHVAHDRQQRLDLRALAALPSVGAIGQPERAGGHGQKRQAEERESREIERAHRAEPGSKHVNGRARSRRRRRPAPRARGRGHGSARPPSPSPTAPADSGVGSERIQHERNS